MMTQFTDAYMQSRLHEAYRPSEPKLPYQQNLNTKGQQCETVSMLNVCMYVYVCVFMYIYMYMYMYMCIYIYNAMSVVALAIFLGASASVGIVLAPQIRNILSLSLEELRFYWLDFFLVKYEVYLAWLFLCVTLVSHDALISRIAVLSNSCEIALTWMPQNTFEFKSTLVPLIAWYNKTFI